MDNGELSINPILNQEDQFQGAKVDLRLDNVFQRSQTEDHTSQDSKKILNQEANEFFDPWREIVKPYDPDEGAFIIHPQEFALAETFEYVDLPSSLLGRLGGRSTLARLGIVIHATASVIDPGYSGTITLELSNFGDLPVKLYPLQRVAAITFEELEGDYPEEYIGTHGGYGPTGAVKQEDKDDENLDDKILNMSI